MNGENILTEKQTRELAKERFSKMVGWTAIKEQILMLLLSARISGFFPNLLFIAPAGLGKTRFLRIVASLVKDVLDRNGVWFDRGLDMGTPPPVAAQAPVAQKKRRGDSPRPLIGLTSRPN